MYYDGKTRQQRRWADRRMKKIEAQKRRAAIRAARRKANQSDKQIVNHGLTPGEEES